LRKRSAGSGVEEEGGGDEKAHSPVRSVETGEEAEPEAHTEALTEEAQSPVRTVTTTDAGVQVEGMSMRDAEVVLEYVLHSAVGFLGAAGLWQQQRLGQVPLLVREIPDFSDLIMAWGQLALVRLLILGMRRDFRALAEIDALGVEGNLLVASLLHCAGESFLAVHVYVCRSVAHTAGELTE
jgi:hypothetical protein